MYVSPNNTTNTANIIIIMGAQGSSPDRSTAESRRKFVHAMLGELKAGGPYGTPTQDHHVTDAEYYKAFDEGETAAFGRHVDREWAAGRGVSVDSFRDSDDMERYCIQWCRRLDANQGLWRK
jgi:hypothetical protein